MQDTTQCEFQCQMVGCPMNDVAFEREIVEVFGLESTVRERTRTLDRNKRLQGAKNIADNKARLLGITLLDHLKLFRLRESMPLG